jgi:O-antigen/teichoic acid export membrane protein
LPLGALGALVVRQFSVPFQEFGSGFWVLTIFAVGVSLTAVSLVLDQAVLARGAGGLQVIRNGVASASKLLILPLLLLAGTARGGGVVYLAWQLGTVVSLLAVLAVLRQSGPQLRGLGAGFRQLGRARSAVVGHHALNLSLQLPTLLLPVVVAVTLGSRDNAYFNTARLLSGFVFLLPFALTIALFAQSAGNPSELLRKSRKTIPLGLAVSVGANIVLLVVGGRLMGIFGHVYASGGTEALNVLTWGGPPLVIKDHYVALKRVSGRTLEAARIGVAGGILEVVAAGAGAVRDGLRGACLYWVLALLAEAVVCGLLIRRQMMQEKL